MTLIEAIKSGRAFKRPNEDTWYGSALDWANSFQLHSHNNHSLVADDVMADDWEVAEPTVTITRAQFWEAFDTICKQYIPGVTCRDGWVPPIGSVVSELAKRLGLDPKETP